MKEFSIKLGQNLKHARLVSGMSQTEVAEKLGVASTVICSWSMDGIILALCISSSSLTATVFLLTCC